MRRTGFDDRRDQQTADDFNRTHAPCSFCGGSTEHDTLVEYGARCGPCFTQYVTGGRRSPPMPTMEQKKAALLRLAAVVANSRPGRDWAHRMKAREEAGEQLNMAQRSCWRAAFRNVQAVAE